jgi:hypothetical protein
MHKELEMEQTLPAWECLGLLVEDGHAVFLWVQERVVFELPAAEP